MIQTPSSYGRAREIYHQYDDRNENQNLMVQDNLTMRKSNVSMRLFSNTHESDDCDDE